MTDRPIIFSGPMARALLVGRKTQDRRIVKPAPFVDRMGNFCAPDRKGKIWNWGQHGDGRPYTRNFIQQHIRFAPGDRLYVREAWRFQLEYEHLPGSELPQMRSLVEYDLDVRQHGSREAGRYRHARFMPRWASRLTLIVESVRVERLQEISEADAIAEGLEWLAPTYGVTGIASTWNGDPRKSYRSLWSTLHTKPGERWEDNPWVAIPSFQAIHGNIDRLPVGARG